MEKIIYDTHMHTPLSRHATGWPVDYAKEAIKKNFKGIIFTDHGTVKQYPWVTDVWTIPERIFKEYFSLIEFTKEYIGDALDIRLGLEVDFIPNNLDMDFLKDLVSCAPFDCLLGSVHCRKPYVWEKQAPAWGPQKQTGCCIRRDRKKDPGTARPAPAFRRKGNPLQAQSVFQTCHTYLCHSLYFSISSVTAKI